MPPYQRIEDPKWILKRRRASLLDMVLESNGYRLFDTETLRVFHDRDVIFNESGSIGEQRREGVGNRPLVGVVCQNICSDGDDNSQEATGP